MAELYEYEIPDFDEKLDYDSEADLNSGDENSETMEKNDDEENTTEKYSKTNSINEQASTKKMETTCKYCKIELKFPNFNPISGKRHIQQCRKYHSFITDGYSCIFCKKSQKSIGHLFNHLGSKHSMEISNLQNSSKISKTTKIEKKNQEKRPKTNDNA